MPISGFNTNGSGTKPPMKGFVPTAKTAIDAFNAKFNKPKPVTPVQEKPTQPVKTGALASVSSTAPTVSPIQNVQQGTVSGVLPKPQTPSTYAQQVTEASQPSAKADYYSNAAVQGMQAQNVGKLAPYAESKFYGQGGQSQGALPSLSLPDLAGRGAPDQQLFNSLGNIYGSAAQTGLTNALRQQELQQSGANINLQASLPQTISPGQTAYNPIQGQNLSGIGGNAFSGGVQQGNVAQGQLYAQMNGAHQASQGIKGQVQSYLAQNPNLNPSVFTNVNSALQFVNGKVGNPQYQTLSNYINEYISTLAPILGVGGDTTNLKTQIAQGFVNAQANGQSINDVLNNIDQLAKIKLDAIATAGQGGQVQTQPSTSGLAPDEEQYLRSRGYSEEEIQALKGSVGNTSASIPQTSRLAFVNNNPGNLRFAGQSGAVQGEGGFAKFSSPAEGVKALENQIRLDASRGLTLAQFISKYAPPSENDTARYIQDVIHMTGTSPTTLVSNIDIKKLTKAIAQKESGTQIYG